MKKFFIPLMLFSTLAFSQVTDIGTVYSNTYQIKSTIPTTTMPSFDLTKLKLEDEKNDKEATKPFRFGKEFEVKISPKNEGVWTTLDNGDRIWQINIVSKDARTLNFILDQYQLSPNAKLYIHNDKKQFLGYYTAKENTKNKQVSTWLIDGEKATIEFYEPKAEIGQSTFEISKIVHGYRSVKNIEDNTKGLNTSGHCNVDVDCAAGDDWEKQKQSVALILSSGSAWCTGTLINNTAEDGTPYFLTANHCINSQTTSWAFRFKWISENPDCGTTAPSGDGPKTFSMSGASIVAKDNGTDFLLLKLNNDIPENWDLTYAGWDRSGNIPENVTGLHHPDGDIMKISQYYSSPIKSTRYGVTNWEIADWDLGMTEGGSSGSGLFDQNGRIIGQLYGGEASCSGTNTNGKWDNYGRFDVSWEGGGTPQTRLKDWLDPINTGANTLDYYPFIQLNDDLALQEIISNATCDGEVNAQIKVINKGINPVTTFNLKYHYNDEADATIPWSGNLQPNETVLIDLPSSTHGVGVHNLSATIESTNDENLNNNSGSTVFEVLETYETDKITINLTTDRYAVETSWKIFDENNNVIAQNAALQNNSTTSTVVTLPENGCYRFEIYDEYGDGICCNYGEGSYSIQTEDGTIIKEGASFGSVETTNFKIDKNLSNQNFAGSKFEIYPNPTNDEITLDVDAKFGTYNYEIFSMTGQKLGNGKANGKTKLYMKSYGKGVYMIHIKTENGKSISKKVMVK